MALPGPGPVQSSSTSSSSAPPNPSWMNWDSNGGVATDWMKLPTYTAGELQPDGSTAASTNSQIRNASADYMNTRTADDQQTTLNNVDATRQYANINTTADQNYGKDLMNYASMGVGRMPGFQNYALNQGDNDISQQSGAVAMDTYSKNAALNQLTQQAQNRLMTTQANANETNTAAAVAANKIKDVTHG